MADVELRTESGLAYREALGEGPAPGDPVVLLHGFPESSRMWGPLMAGLAAAGRHCIAPDLYGLGDSVVESPITFERTLEAFTEFIEERDLPRVGLVVHDWGGFIGLAWACEHPDRVSSLVISSAGFFSDGKWHGMAEAIRGEQGEAIVAAIDREGFAGLLEASGNAFDEDDIADYWRPYEDGRGRRATLDFYRSMDFEKLAPWRGMLGELGVPTLLLWGAEDQFAPIAGAHRFQREIPGASSSRSRASGTSSTTRPRSARSPRCLPFSRADLFPPARGAVGVPVGAHQPAPGLGKAINVLAPLLRRIEPARRVPRPVGLDLPRSMDFPRTLRLRLRLVAGFRLTP